MFGEAFTAAERDKRGIVFDLFAEGEDGKPMTFSIPENLYIIGTMNEIDQSVEALDFALRRRFFWFATPYDQDELFTIWEEHWGEKNVIKWGHARGNLEALASNITRLNKKISELPDLGSEYELGAAVFIDLPYFIDREWRYKKNKKRDGRYLWTSKSVVQTPLTSLWALTVQPVLAQYLAGSDRRVEVLAELREVLFAAPKAQ